MKTDTYIFEGYEYLYTLRKKEDRCQLICGAHNLSMAKKCVKIHREHYKMNPQIFKLSVWPRRRQTLVGKMISLPKIN